MKILNFGSINIDHVYQVDHFVQPGETLDSESYARFAGGKGANQSIALAAAGADVYHAGNVGTDGIWLKEKLENCGADVSFLKITDSPTGHAVIQVNRQGENSIILFGGANRQITKEDAEKTISNFSKGDYLLLQNEISAMPEIIQAGAKAGLKIAFNPAPMHKDILDYPLELISIFIINEIEGSQFTGQNSPADILSAMLGKFPNAAIVLTLGENGVMYRDGESSISVPAEKVTAIDTTAAGDTFTGYFLAEITRDAKIKDALTIASKAAALCVTKLGAADSIPIRDEIEKLL